MKINQNKLARVGLMIVAVGVMAGLGGCSGMAYRPLNVNEIDKSGRNQSVIYASVFSFGAFLSVDQVCSKSPGSPTDKRCNTPSEYYGLGASPYVSSFALGGDPITVLVPKSEKVGANDIIRIRLADGVPAYFEKVITVGGVGFGHNGKQHDTSSDCYNENRSGVAVVCPKFNWSYKDLEPRN